MESTFLELNETIDETIKKCPWTKSQSCLDLIKAVNEELNEVSEALQKNDDNNLEEEIGDLLFTIILLGKISEKNNKINFTNSIKRINEKIKKRSPHVFGNEIALTSEEALNIWNRVKLQEFKSQEFKSN